MKAANNAATTPSSPACADPAQTLQGCNPSRFNKFSMTRYYTDVNVNGFDLRKSIAKARKNKQMHKAKAAVIDDKPTPSAAAKVRGKKGKTTKKAQECPQQQQALI